MDFCVIINYSIKRSIKGVHLAFMLERADGTPVCHSYDIDNKDGKDYSRKPGIYETILRFPGGLLNIGYYSIRLGIARFDGTVFDYCEAFTFKISNHEKYKINKYLITDRPGILAIKLDWKTYLEN